MRENISSGTTWESLYGYSRAVKVGNMVFVAGTVASDEEGRVQGETGYEQTHYIFQKIERALQQAGASLEDVVRTRMFVVDITRHSDEIGRAHGEVFKDIRPVATMVEISKLIGSDYLIEIEVDAVITSG